MEEKIITAIQNIHSKSKQRETSQRIFRFINKVALIIECEHFQDFMNKLEIEGRIYKEKRDKNASFFINPIRSDSKKNDQPDSVERVHKYLELPKPIEKLESSADHDTGNIQNARPIMRLIIHLCFIEKIIHVDLVVIYVLTIGFFTKKLFF